MKILSLMTVIIALANGMTVYAAQFTAGNIVVYRVGDGSTLTNTGNTVFLDEYTTNGAFVQTITMPTNYFGANSPLIGNGTAFGSGLITRSVDGRFILVAGYGAKPGQGTTSLGTSFANSIPRVVGLVDGAGNKDTTTALTNTFSGGSSGGETRGAVSVDGTNIWTGGDSLSGGGIQYTGFGSNDAVNLIGFNTRQLLIYSNQIYMTGANFGGLGATGSIGILSNAFGTTLPTATNRVGIIGLGAATTNAFSPEGFVLFKLKAGAGSDPDTLYLADGSATGGQVMKFSLVGGVWVLNGAVGGINSSIGLTGVTTINGSQTNVSLYLTQGGATLSGGDNIASFTDTSGYNNPPTSADLALIVNGVTGKGLRGIVMAPTTNSALALPSGPGKLSVGPAIDIFAKAFTGCANTTETDVYSLANSGTSSINWTASVDSNWVSLSPSSGTLPSMGSVNVTATLNGNITGLTAATNTATVTFSNTTSALGSTTRAVTLFLSPQDITPTTDYVITGQPGGPFTPTNKNYTVFNGSTPITLAVSKSATWLNLSATSVPVGACTSTVISISVNTNNANLLAAGNYADVISFSNATAGTLIDTRAVSLTVGGVFFCDDFSTFVQNAPVEGQQGWVAFNAQPSLYVSNNAVFDPGATTPFDEPYKNFPLTTNGTVYAAMQIVIDSAPPVTTTAPSRGPTFFVGQNEGGFARDYLSARDTGSGTFVFAIRKNGAGNPFIFGTNALTYGTTYRVIVAVDAGPSDTFQALYVNPASACLATNTAYLVAQNVGAIDAGVGSYSFQSQFTSSPTPSPGYHVFKCCITTNCTDAFNDIQAAPSDPYSTWAAFYGLSGGNALGTADPDGDGVINTNEFLSGFNPTNSSARVRVISVAASGIDEKVTYLGSSGDSNGSPGPKTNVLEFTAGTAANGSYTNNYVSTGQTNILSGGNGLGTVTNMTDSGGATNTPSRYYRVRVLTP